MWDDSTSLSSLSVSNINYRIFIGRLELDLLRQDRWMWTTSVLDIVRKVREIFVLSPPTQGMSHFDKIDHVQVQLDVDRMRNPK